MRGVPVALVQRDRQHVGAVPEDALRAVADVYVPVDDRDPLGAARERVLGAAGDVVEVGRGDRAVGLGVVPGRPGVHERRRHAPVEHGVDCGQHAAHGQRGGLPRGRRHRGVLAVPRAAGARVAQALEVRGRVHGQQGLLRRGPQRDPLERTGEPAALDELVRLRAQRRLGDVRGPERERAPGDLQRGRRRVVGEQSRGKGVAEHVSSYCTAMSGTAQWWKSAVVYQIYPRSFADGDGDGIGDLAGIEQRLDHLAELGVDVLWLSPIYPSPQDDAGYDISDYQDIDPTFGSLAGFDRLLAAVHERGMKLVMDLVVNHTSDEHPWFAASRSSPTDPKRDWYWWRPPRAGMRPGDPGAEPTNWRSFFSGPVWELDPASGEYYLHLFSRKQPDLNWENPEVRRAVHAMMRWWLDRGVDGFRMDVINMLSKDPALPDGHPHGLGGLGDGTPHFLDGPRIHEFLQEMHREVFAGRGGELLTVGEMPGVTVEEALLYTDPARAEVDMVFQFEHVQLDQGETKWDVHPLRLRDLKASLNRWQVGLAERGWNSLYWNNHDQPRVVSRFGDDGAHRVRSAKLLGTVLHLHRGTPYVYQGEELGMTNAPFAGIEDFRDIESLNHYAEAVALGHPPDDVLAALRAMGRDNARTPMQWDASEHAGFTTGTPWLPVNPNHREINAEAARADPDSVFHHYRALIELRHTEPAVAHGDFTMVLPDDERIYAFTRRHGDVELLVLANFSGEAVSADLPDAAGWVGAEVVIGNCPAPAQPRTALALEPWEARVHRRRV
jgi:oligo-1,6-glucosidase